MGAKHRVSKQRQFRTARIPGNGECRETVITLHHAAKEYLSGDTAPVQLCQTFPKMSRGCWPAREASEHNVRNPPGKAITMIHLYNHSVLPAERVAGVVASVQSLSRHNHKPVPQAARPAVRALGPGAGKRHNNDKTIIDRCPPSRRNAGCASQRHPH